MTKTRAQLFSLVTLLVAVFSVFTFARVTATSQETMRPDADPLLKEIAGYKRWTRVTPQAVLVPNAAAAG